MRLFFKCYFWLMAVLYVVAIGLTIGDGEHMYYMDIVDYAISLVTLAGVFAYSFSKKIFSSLFWKCYLPFIIIWEGVYFSEYVFNDPDMYSDEYGLTFVIFAVAVFIVFIIPSYVAIYLYGRDR